jgi:uncharacterized protein
MRVTRTPRLIALDALRGLAVMGILLMNVTGFAMPPAAYMNPAAYGSLHGADIAAWATGFVLVDGKMRALFSLLFGASMLLVIDRADQAGEDSASVHFRRMGWLFVIGLAHAYLVWAGDILVPYAIVGMVAYAYVERSTRQQIVLAAILLVGQWLLLWSLLSGLAATRDAAAVPDAGAAAVQAWRGIADQIGVPSAEATARLLAIYRGDYVGILHDRLARWTTPFLQLIDIGAETLALMLLGMAGLKSGFLTGAWSRTAYTRVALGCYLVALPALAFIAFMTTRSGFDEIATLRAAELYAAPFRPLVMIGHVSLAMLWLSGAGQNALVARVAATGRMAFSNYLGTSLVMTTIFYGYGLGWFGRLDRAELYLLVPPMWIAMLLWSKPWLDRYRFGPLEWVWRSLARGAAQPMRRTVVTIES